MERSWVWPRGFDFEDEDAELDEEVGAGVGVEGGGLVE